jgi:hypothetical protein
MLTQSTSRRTWLSAALYLALVCTFSLLGGGKAQGASGASCGDDQLVCGSDEKCCEHPRATFCEGSACASVHVDGKCIPKEQACGDFWCGNRHCQSSWLLSKNVCCVYYQTGEAPEYSCASSELSCPGNSAQLTIRPTVASRQLQSVESN